MVAPANREEFVLDRIAKQCNFYMRMCFGGVKFKSPQNREIVKTYFVGAMDWAIETNCPDKGLIIGAVGSMIDPNWWPDERFRF